MHHSCTAVRYLRVADSGSAAEREAAERAAAEAAARHAEELGRLRADVSAAQARSAICNPSTFEIQPSYMYVVLMTHENVDWRTSWNS